MNPSDPQVAVALHALLAQVGVQAGTWSIQSIFWLIFYGSLGLVALSLILPGRRRVIAVAEHAAEPVQAVGI